MASFAFNLKLCRALEKQPILYNHSHEDYRKRLASENCWDLVASEVGDSVEKCKRRWRQIRTDYSRWMSSDEQRQINGLKRPPQFYLAEELAFLKPHLSQSDQAEREGESAERERDRKSKSKEPLSKDSPNKGKQKEVEETVEELPLAHLKRAAGSSNTETETGEKVEEKKEKDKNKDKDIKEKTKEKDTNKKDKKLESKQKKDNKQKHTVAETVEKQQEPDSIQTDDKEQSEGTATPTASLESAASAASDSFKQPEFFIKQSTNRSSNNLIIGKKRAVSPPIDPLFHQMAEDSPDETASIGGGRRLRRSRIKHNAIEKVVAEQRVTRGRRKSIAVTAATSLLRTSPVKMTPLPRTSLPAKPQAKTQPTPPPPPPPPKPTTPNIVSGNDDIFPRARAAAAPTPPQQQQVVMARMPSAPMPPQQQRPQPIATPAQLRGGFSVLRMQAPPKPGMPSSAPYGQASASAVRTAVNVSSGDVFKMPATGATTATTKFPTHSQAQTQHHYHPHSHSHQQVQAQQQQPQRLVSNSNTLVITSPSCSSSVPTPVLTLVKRCERGIQTESPDTFSDDHFLDMLRPQMKEMNQRQKMHFKQKIFHSLMETFDDATDFPSSGEVQHFNINTPSGYDHVTDRELRLIRELASLVTAVKHTADPKTPSSSPGSNHRMVQLKQQVLHRVIRPTHGGSVASSSLGEEQKKLYRVMQMANNNNNNNNKALAVHRRESIDSNSSNGTSTTSTPSRPMHFVVPTNSNKTTPQSKEATSMLTNNQNAVARVNPATGDTTSTGATLVRQMGRRYSVCGPVATFSSNNAALTNSTTTDAALLKRRIVASPLAGMPPQQRPRFSTSPVAPAATGQAMNAGDSFLMPRSVMNGGQTVRQKSPTGPNVSPVQLRPPQKASIQNRAGKEYVTPTFMRGNSVSGSGAAINYGIGPTTSLSPQKRSMVIANVKGNVVQKSQMRTQQAKQLPLPSTGANVANLLSETTRKQAEPERRPSMVQEPPKDTEMAGIIAADDFDMTRFKREPQDIVDDHDILGM